MAEILGPGRIRTSDLVHRKPIPLPLNYREFSPTQSLGILLYPYPHNEVEGVYLNHHGCLSVYPSVRLSVDTILSGAFLLQFCTYYSEFIHNVCVHMKLFMCNFYDHTIIVCEIIGP